MRSTQGKPREALGFWGVRGLLIVMSLGCVNASAKTWFVAEYLFEGCRSNAPRSPQNQSNIICSHRDYGSFYPVTTGIVRDGASQPGSLPTQKEWEILLGALLPGLQNHQADAPFALARSPVSVNGEVNVLALLELSDQDIKPAKARINTDEILKGVVALPGLHNIGANDLKHLEDLLRSPKGPPAAGASSPGISAQPWLAGLGLALVMATALDGSRHPAQSQEALVNGGQLLRAYPLFHGLAMTHQNDALWTALMLEGVNVLGSDAVEILRHNLDDYDDDEFEPYCEVGAAIIPPYCANQQINEDFVDEGKLDARIGPMTPDGAAERYLPKTPWGPQEKKYTDVCSALRWAFQDACEYSMNEIGPQFIQTNCYEGKASCRFVVEALQKFSGYSKYLTACEKAQVACVEAGYAPFWK